MDHTAPVRRSDFSINSQEKKNFSSRDFFCPKIPASENKRKQNDRQVPGPYLRAETTETSIIVSALEKATGWTGDQRKNQDHSTVKIR